MRFEYPTAQAWQDGGRGRGRGEGKGYTCVPAYIHIRNPSVRVSRWNIKGRFWLLSFFAVHEDRAEDFVSGR